ncbi:hypothetical protein BH09PSE1_BH09PSE1_07700 [soil metagenome]
MIWLRHELWEHNDGLSYRLANWAETQRLAAAHPEGVLKHVFYAPNTAAAVAQFYALRQLGPYVPGPDVSEEGFTLAQLESQLTDFPEDKILAGQPALLQALAAHPAPEPEPEAAQAPVEGHDAAPVEPDHSVETPAEPHTNEHPLADKHDEPVEPEAAEHALSEPHEPEPAVQASGHEIVEAPHSDHPVADEPLSLASPTAPPAPHDPLDLWPVTPDEVVAPRWARKKRKPNVFLGILRVIVLLIVIGAVIVGVGIATGTLDGPTLLAQVRDLSIVKSVLPST